MKVTNRRRERVAAVFEKLKEKAIPAALHDQIVGWLITDHDRDEKDRQLAEFFADNYDYAREPSKRAYQMYEAFCKRNGIDNQEPAKAPESKPARIPLLRNTALRYAAAIITVAVSVGVSLWVAGHYGSDARQFATVTVSVPVAGERTLLLPDSSTVTVYGGGRITYAEGFGQGRKVELDGTARFDVKRDEQRPFTVHTKYFDIAVLGTGFKVHSHEGEDISTVDLYHGSVRVDTDGESVTLRPGQHLSYDHTTGSIGVRRIKIDELDYGQMPEMVFDRANLREVFDVLERKYGVMIQIEGDVQQDKGGICADLSQAQSIDRVMSILSMTTGRFDYTIADTTIIVRPIRR